MSTAEELIAELRGLAEKATPGPWEWEPPSEDSYPMYDESLVTAYIPEGESYPDTVVSGWGYDASGTSASDEDRAFIAAVDPSTVLRLLDLIEAQDRAIREALEHIAHAMEFGQGDGFVYNILSSAVPEKEDKK